MRQRRNGGLVVFLLVLSLIAVLVFLLIGLPTIRAKALFSNERHPETYVVPEEHLLSFEGVEAGESFPLPAHRAVIRVPWMGGAMEESNRGTLLRFPNQRSVIVLSPEKHPYAYEAVVGATPEQVRRSAEFYGANIVGSGFNFRSTILAATPQQFHWTMGPRSLASLNALLTMKSIFLSDGGREKVFLIRTDAFEGYQVGQARVDTKTRLYLFERGAIGPEYVLVIQAEQREVDYIVAHLRIGN
jgi:hypothetical protein